MHPSHAPATEHAARPVPVRTRLAGITIDVGLLAMASYAFEFAARLTHHASLVSYVQFGLVWFYFALAPAVMSATIGQRCTKQYIVTSSGHSLTPLRAVLRCVALACPLVLTSALVVQLAPTRDLTSAHPGADLSSFAPLAAALTLAALSLASAALDPQRRMLHDRLSATRVVLDTPRIQEGTTPTHHAHLSATPPVIEAAHP
jgi:uncharacterized RDD family membrane protein YckC